MAAAPRLAFAVISRARPEGLARLVAALDRQARDLGADDCELRVVVNQPIDEPYRKVLDGWSGALPLRWRSCMEPGIPMARNALVAWLLQEPPDAAVFLDDDEIPSEGWLARLLALQQQYPETILSGPVVATRDSSSASFLLRHGAFDRVRRLQSGALTREAYTNNTLVPLAALQALGASFDARFTRTGGSDTEWFRRAHGLGFPIRYFRELTVTEALDPARSTLASLLARWLRNGTTDTLIRRRQQPGIVAVPGIVGRGLGRSFAGLAGTAGCALLLQPRPMLRSLKLALSGMGSLLGLFSLSPRQY